MADIEAMCATSRFLLVGISMSPDTLQFIRELYEGIYAANAKGGISVMEEIFPIAETDHISYYNRRSSRNI